MFRLSVAVILENLKKRIERLHAISTRSRRLFPNLKKRIESFFLSTSTTST